MGREALCSEIHLARIVVHVFLAAIDLESNSKSA